MNVVDRMKKAHFMLRAHGVMFVSSIMRVVLHKHHTILADLMEARPYNWLELKSFASTALPKFGYELAKSAYQELRQTRLLTALVVAPPAWLVWLIALGGERLLSVYC